MLQAVAAKNATPTNPKIMQMISNASISFQQKVEKDVPFLFPTKWFKANPNYLNYFPFPKESVSALAEPTTNRSSCKLDRQL